jgi:hypothetical protein
VLSVGICGGIGQRVSQKMLAAVRGYMQKESSPAEKGGCDEAGVLGKLMRYVMLTSLNRPAWAAELLRQ